MTATTRLALTALAVTAVALAGRPAAAQPVRLDCRGGSTSCPEVLIEGDPWATLPGPPPGQPSPFRGYGDPSMRRDPVSGRLWMTYSYLDLHLPTGPPTLPAEFAVSIHLASSDDDGATWQFRRSLAESLPATNPVFPWHLGVSVHEVSTLAPLQTVRGTRWFGMHLAYFQPFGPEERRPESFHFRLNRATSATKLARRPTAHLAGPLAHPAWDIDLDLSSLDSELGACDVWTEPALFAIDTTLYLVAQCIVIDEAQVARRPREEFLGVFATSGNGPVDRLDWRWVGKLSDRSDARALGGDVLTQPDLAWSRDGGLVLLVTPKRLRQASGNLDGRHRGCRAVEVVSLDPPRLARRASGKPIVLADIRSSDSSGLGPGLCAYDPASSTGVLFVRTEIDLDLPDIVFRLHATGVHP